ncbi:uncharacterized protein LOC125108844 isoform X2 [Lutra lutra]|uniref:uncharacterized protein LOC125108844 isoform X1 n=1 Tax=Lutra lutra TaxID=9657 RepID=UPI001FD35939|nr:uncharacterized protein LOC125108844 isoform X1 [Lutra lutra]XP_047601155.1 uncharacterized protein LOC125108844 isoform X2 [Lutra lutra]
MQVQSSPPRGFLPRHGRCVISPACSSGLSEGQAGICREEKVAHGWPWGCGPDPISQPVRTATEQGGGTGCGFQGLGDTWAGWRGPSLGLSRILSRLGRLCLQQAAAVVHQARSFCLSPSPMGTRRALGAASLKEPVASKARAHLCLLVVAVARVTAPPAVPARTRGLPAPSRPETPPCSGETGAQTGGRVCPKPGSLWAARCTAWAALFCLRCQGKGDVGSQGEDLAGWLTPRVGLLPPRASAHQTGGLRLSAASSRCVGTGRTVLTGSWGDGTSSSGRDRDPGCRWGQGDSPVGGTWCPDGGSGSSPGSRTPGAKGESPPPSTQPPAGARWDAQLGKHGASLGLK